MKSPGTHSCRVFVVVVVVFFFSEMQKAEAIKKKDTFTASEFKLFVVTMIL